MQDLMKIFGICAAVAAFFKIVDALIDWRARRDMKSMSRDWIQVPPDKRIATIARALEVSIFPPGDVKSEIGFVVDGATAQNLRIVLRWCQAPMKFAEPVGGRIAGID